MPEEARAELDVDAVGCVRKEISTQAADDRFEESDGNEADYQNIKRGNTAMDQDLVDDDLEEKRSDEGEDLEKEGCNQHLAEQSTILIDRAQEPGYVETAADIGESGAARHDNKPAVPNGIELRACHRLRTRSLRSLDEDFVLANF